MSLKAMCDSIRQYLASNNMYVVEKWLNGCVEHLIEHTGNNEDNIKSTVVEQWLLNDLRDICPGCLPADLKNQKKIVLTGIYVLQINSVLDIGASAYQQYLTLSNVNMENVEATTRSEDKVSSRRLIKLDLTDGEQEVTAIEYKPIIELGTKGIPGSKIRIKGPIECRRGTLLLTENAIEWLGGEVDKLEIDNSLPNMLAAKLGLLRPQELNLNTTNQHHNANMPAPHTRMPSSTEASASPSEPSGPASGEPPAATASPPPVFDDTDDEAMASIDIQIPEIPENSAKRSIHEGPTNTAKKLKVEPTTSATLQPALFKSNSFGDYPDDDDFFSDVDEESRRELEAQLDWEEKKMYSNPNDNRSTVPSEALVKINQINDMPAGEKAGKVFKVKGQIMKLQSRLEIVNDLWNLSCTVEDGTGEIDAMFTSDVLTSLIGFTPQGVKQLRSQFATKEERNKQFGSALKKAQDTLQELDGIIQLTMEEPPKITGLLS